LPKSHLARIQKLEQAERIKDRTLRNQQNPSVNRWAVDATADTYTWVTEHTETRNEHWVEENRPSPYEKFPKFPYFQVLFRIFELESIVWTEKSRDLMVSWACVAYLTIAKDT